jgi:hypothetical protein
VERLQDITEVDAIAEGLTKREMREDGMKPTIFKPGTKEYGSPFGWTTSPRTAFQLLWESINGKESWTANPYVWVVAFNRLESK